jgi:hypothetical protein
MRWLFPFLRGSLRYRIRSIEVCPFDSADFVLTHRGRNSEANDPPDRNLLTGIGVKSRDYTIEFILCWSSVTLIPFSDEAKPCERRARQEDRLDRQYDAVHGSRVQQHSLDISQISSDRDRACAFARLILPELDKPPAIKLRDLQPPQPVVKKGEAGRFGSSNAFTHFL